MSVPMFFVSWRRKKRYLPVESRIGWYPATRAPPSSSTKVSSPA
jgi:hypothetical protein